jgi:hypothetical protein
MGQFAGVLLVGKSADKTFTLTVNPAGLPGRVLLVLAIEEWIHHGVNWQYWVAHPARGQLAILGGTSNSQPLAYGVVVSSQ